MQGRRCPNDPSRIILDSQPKGCSRATTPAPEGSARLSSRGVDSNYRYKIVKKQNRQKARVSFQVHGTFPAAPSPHQRRCAGDALRIVTLFSGAARASGTLVGRRSRAFIPRGRVASTRYAHRSAYSACLPARLKCNHRHTIISLIINFACVSGIATPGIARPVRNKPARSQASERP